MSLRITVNNVTELDERVWSTSLDPKDVKSLPYTDARAGEVSLIQLKGDVDSPREGVIYFMPDQADVLLVGHDRMTYFIRTCSSANTSENVMRPRNQEVPSSVDQTDRSFLDTLSDQPEIVKRLGRSFITEIRRHLNGELRPSDSGRFIEYPDNFWTVKPQPRDKSLAITIRGYVRDFDVPGDITLKKDRTGYSRFKIKAVVQVSSAISLIKQADLRR